MIKPNIWGAFRGIGVKYSVVHGLQRVSFDEMTLRERKGLKELWGINFPVGNLSPRRESCKFGWINEPEQNGIAPSSSNFSDEAGRYSNSQESRKSEEVAFESDSPYICVYSWDFCCYHF
jgi:hypothetical protein